MSSDWYVFADGKKRGPLNSVELRQLAARGFVKTDTLVARSPDGPWVKASRIKGLVTGGNSILSTRGSRDMHSLADSEHQLHETSERSDDLPPFPPDPEAKRNDIQSLPEVCPGCGWHEWKRVSLIHEEGSSSSQSTIFGERFGGFYQFAIAEIAGTSVTNLAQRARPPKTNPLYGLLVVVGIIVIVLGVFAVKEFEVRVLMGVLGIVLVVWNTRRVIQEEEKLQVAKAKWLRMRMCVRCGLFYDPVT